MADHTVANNRQSDPMRTAPSRAWLLFPLTSLSEMSERGSSGEGTFVQNRSSVWCVAWGESQVVSPTTLRSFHTLLQARDGCQSFNDTPGFVSSPRISDRQFCSLPAHWCGCWVASIGYIQYEC